MDADGSNPIPLTTNTSEDHEPSWSPDGKRIAFASNRNGNYYIYVMRPPVLKDLRVPPGNRLEALRGTWKGSHSIRIKDQWRIVFKWQGGSAYPVEIIDYL